MSYVTQTTVGKNPQRRVNVNASHLMDAIPLDQEELDFIRRRERKFHLNDEEIADYYAMKILNEISVAKSKILVQLAVENITRELKGVSPSREQLRLLQSSLRLINPDLQFISEDNLDLAKTVLDQPLNVFSKEALEAIFSVQQKFLTAENRKHFVSYDFRKTEQPTLIEAGISTSTSLAILNLLPHQAADASNCCQAYVAGLPCHGCGLNVGYNRIEIERTKKGLPEFGDPSRKLTTPPSRLFVYR